jgi:hypothetical protein
VRHDLAWIGLRCVVALGACAVGACSLSTERAQPTWPDANEALDAIRASGDVAGTPGTGDALRLGFNPGSRSVALTSALAAGRLDEIPVEAMWLTGHAGTRLVQAGSVVDGGGERGRTRGDSRALGAQLALAMVEGRLDCAVMGAATLLISTGAGVQWAVVTGTDPPGYEGTKYQLWVREGVEHEGAATIIGSSLISPVSGPFGRLAALELLEQLGVPRNEEQQDLQVPRAELDRSLANPRHSYVFGPASLSQRIERGGGGFLPLDVPKDALLDGGMNPGLLVCTQAAVAQYGDEVAALAALLSEGEPAEAGRAPSRESLSELDAKLLQHGLIAALVADRLTFAGERASGSGEPEPL